MSQVPKKTPDREVVMSVAEKAAALTVQKLESQLTMARRVQALLRAQPTTRPLRFKVKLVSMWADHGEKPVTIERSGRLDMTINTAEREFMKRNNRSDIQARYFVWLMVKDGKRDMYQIVLPDQIWEHYTARKRQTVS